MSYNIYDEIRIIRKNQAIKAESPIPPGVVGYDPNYRNRTEYDPALANKLLDQGPGEQPPNGGCFSRALHRGFFTNETPAETWRAGSCSVQTDRSM